MQTEGEAMAESRPARDSKASRAGTRAALADRSLNTRKPANQGLAASARSGTESRLTA